MGHNISNGIQVGLTQSLLRNRGIEEKKALLVGLNYEGTSAALSGCINDAKNFKRLLQRNFAFRNVQVLTDKQLTKGKNVLESLEEFLAEPKKVMVFHYSGHGTQTIDYDGDEADGRDEALYTKHGVLASDDEINALIEALPRETKLLVVIDACHSGSILDLEWQMKDDGKIYKVSDKSIDADVICISGCRDNQVSMDIQEGFTSYGALSNSLSTLLKQVNNQTMTWKEFGDQLRASMRSKRYAQVSQMSVSRRELFDDAMLL